MPRPLLACGVPVGANGRSPLRKPARFWGKAGNHRRHRKTPENTEGGRVGAKRASPAWPFAPTKTSCPHEPPAGFGRGAEKPQKAQKDHRKHRRSWVGAKRASPRLKHHTNTCGCRGARLCAPTKMPIPNTPRRLRGVCPFWAKSPQGDFASGRCGFNCRRGNTENTESRG